MKTKFTEGKWVSIGTRIFSTDEEGKTKQLIAVVRTYLKDRRQHRYNAKLIAAAPELLESLVTILASFESCIAGGNGELEGDKDDIARAVNAIKKATE